MYVEFVGPVELSTIKWGQYQRGIIKNIRSTVFILDIYLQRYM